MTAENYAWASPVEAPVRTDRRQRVFERTGIFTARRRQCFFLFLPGVVLQFGRRQNASRSLGREIRASRAAARNPFWSSLAATGLAVGRIGKLSLRYRPACADDFPAVAALVEERAEAAMDYPRVHALDDIAVQRLIRALDPDEGRAATAMLASLLLPATSRHGDFHLWNFVSRRQDFALIDWEEYEPDGSFAYDYLNFHLSVMRVNADAPWPAVLPRIPADHPAIARLAGRLRAEPSALLLYFVLVKTGTLLDRAFGENRWSRETAQEYLPAVRRAAGLAA